MPVDEAIVAEFAEMGVSVPAELIEEEDVFEIWDTNVAVFEAFRALDTQWHFISGFSGVIRTGLNYAGVDLVMRSRAMEVDQLPFLQAMESAALDAYREVGS